MTDQSDMRQPAALPPPLPRLRSVQAEGPSHEADPATVVEHILPRPAPATAEREPPSTDWSLSPGERISPPPAREGGRRLLTIAAVAVGLTAIGAGGLLLSSWRKADPPVLATPVSVPGSAEKVVDAVRRPAAGVRDAAPPPPAAAPPPAPVETAALPAMPAAPSVAPAAAAKAPEPSAIDKRAAPASVPTAATTAMKPTILNAPAPTKTAPPAEPTRPSRSELPPASMPKAPPEPRQIARTPHDVPPDGPPPRDLRPPSADSRDPVQMRAAAVGLHPQLPRDLLARLSPSDLRNADIAIQTALSEYEDGEVFSWPRQRWADQASYQVRMLRSAEPGCRRYIVTVVKDGWSTSAPPMETCEPSRAPAPRMARDRRLPPVDHDRYDRYR